DGNNCVSACTGDRPYLENGTTCVTSCSSGKRDGNNCVSSCPTDKPYLDSGVCVAACSGTNKYLNGTNCVSSCSGTNKFLNGTKCSSSCPKYYSGTTCVTSCPTDKPYLNAGVCVASCSGTNKYLNGTNCVSSCSGTNKFLNGTKCSSSCPKYYSGTTCVTSCPTDRPYLDGTQCKTASEMATICTNAMKAGGFTSGYTASANTITYSGDMTMTKNLDISACNLVVKGTLTVNSGITLKAKNVSATSSSANGINNAGTMTVTNKIYGNGYTYGIDNKSTGIINANEIDGGQIESSTEYYTVSGAAIVNHGSITVENVYCSNNVSTSTTLGFPNVLDVITVNNCGMRNEATLKAKNIIGKGKFCQVEPGIAHIENIDVYHVALAYSTELSVDNVLRTEKLENSGTLNSSIISAKDLQNASGVNTVASINVDQIIVTGILENYDKLESNIVYAGIISQYACAYPNSFLSFCGGPGSIKSSEIYYCDSYSGGSYSTTPIKKCAETCSGSTPIWNGESCEGCPSIRPNWNAEYGICE
ncbi:MAG: hypothetical protein IJO11_07055, partial [Alphaproteobacteria bacterium]|nr:hypothetical protein [Alphaproteobacteria bacterium]